MRGKRSTLTSEQRAEVRRLVQLRVRLTDKAIARQLGVSEAAVRYAARQAKREATTCG
jgi:DNA-binding CsgD family transcriptional regulator